MLNTTLTPERARKTAFAMTIGIENWLLTQKVVGSCTVLMSQPYAGKIRYFAVEVCGTQAPFTYLRARKPLF